MIQPCRFGDADADPILLKKTLSCVECEVYDLVFQQAMSYMLPNPVFTHKRMVYRASNGVLIACASVQANKGEEGYYFLSQDWPALRWPVGDAIKGFPLATVDFVEVCDALSPSPGQFLQTVFDTSWLCALQAKEAIEVVFGLQARGCDLSPIVDDRERIPMVNIGPVEVDGDRQINLTDYAASSLKTWENYGMADLALTYTTARERYKTGKIDLREAVKEVVIGSGFPEKLASTAHQQMADQIARHRARRNPQAIPVSVG